jgi:hypothetical protein
MLPYDCRNELTEGMLMGKYDPLSRFLANADQDQYDMAFSEIEKILASPLPPSAHRHQAWWANETNGSHSHARSWQEAGWETARISLKGKRVRFIRKRPRGSSAQSPAGGSKPASGSELEDLIDSARALSGIQDRNKVIERALRDFVQREAQRRLIEMGGTMPDFEAAPRERPIA